MTFVDDNGSELNIEGSFAMTKQAVSFFNGSIKGDVSTTFTVDNNSVNRETLGYQGAQMVTQVAWTKQAFNRVRNGNILDRGYIVIQSDNGDSLSCFYVSGNSNWVQLLDGLITELDYTGVTNGKDYTTQITAANVTALTSATDGVIFPMVDWCYDLKKGNSNFFMLGDNLRIVDVTGDIDHSMADFYPCFYLKTLVNEIMSQNDLKISGSILNDPIYKSLIITPSTGEMKREKFKDVNIIVEFGNVLDIEVAPTTTITKYEIWATKGIIVSNNDNLFSLANNNYTANKKSIVRFTIHQTYYQPDVAPVPTLMHLYKNGVSVDSQSIISSPITGACSVYYFLESSAVSGDVFDIRMSTTALTSFYLSLNINISIPEAIGVSDYVEPSLFLPSLKSIDVVKFLINFFGCSTYYNEYSRTLTCNIVENIKTESSYDWSDYFVSNTAEYTVNQAQNNYLKWSNSGSDNAVKRYNQLNLLNFGDGNIETNNTLKKENDLTKFIFTPSSSDYGKNNFYLNNIALVNLTNDGDPIPFTVVATVSAGISRFTVADGTIFSVGEVISVTNSNGALFGYYIITAKAATTIDLYYTFSNTFTGNIRRQRINYQNVGARILSVKPETNVWNFSTSGSFTLYNETGASSTPTTIPYATFTKQVISDGIDQWKNNLAIDNPDSGGFTDPTIKELYFNKISRFFQNPTIKARFLLPEAVYQRFDFDQFIYLKTERLTGYFFVDSIVNYVDGNTPVEIKLYML